MVAIDARGLVVLHIGRVNRADGPAEGYVRFGQFGRLVDTILVGFNGAPVRNPLEGAAVFRAGEPGGLLRARLRQYFPEPLHDLNGAVWVSWAGAGTDIVRGSTETSGRAVTRLPFGQPDRAARDARERHIVAELTGRDIPESAVRHALREHRVLEDVPILEGLFVDRHGRTWAWRQGRHPDSLTVTVIREPAAPATQFTVSRSQWRARAVWGSELIMGGEEDSTGEPLLVRIRLAN
jgi:hypothetical protein